MWKSISLQKLKELAQILKEVLNIESILRENNKILNVFSLFY